MAYSVRTADFRYVEWREPNEDNAVVSRELYDHRNDPEEAINVADDPKHAATIQLHAQLVATSYRSLSTQRESGSRDE